MHWNCAMWIKWKNISQIKKLNFFLKVKKEKRCRKILGIFINFASKFDIEQTKVLWVDAPAKSICVLLHLKIENKRKKFPHLVYWLVFNTSLFNGAVIEKLLVWCLSMENRKYRQKLDAHDFFPKSLQIGLFTVWNQLRENVWGKYESFYSHQSSVSLLSEFLSGLMYISWNWRFN